MSEPQRKKSGHPPATDMVDLTDDDVEVPSIEPPANENGNGQHRESRMTTILHQREQRKSSKAAASNRSGFTGLHTRRSNNGSVSTVSSSFSSTDDDTKSKRDGVALALMEQHEEEEITVNEESFAMSTTEKTQDVSITKFKTDDGSRSRVPSLLPLLRSDGDAAMSYAPGAYSENGRRMTNAVFIPSMAEPLQSMRDLSQGRSEFADESRYLYADAESSGDIAIARPVRVDEAEVSSRGFSVGEREEIGTDKKQKRGLYLLLLAGVVSVVIIAISVSVIFVTQNNKGSNKSSLDSSSPAPTPSPIAGNSSVATSSQPTLDGSLEGEAEVSSVNMIEIIWDCENETSTFPLTLITGRRLDEFWQKMTLRIESAFEPGVVSRDSFVSIDSCSRRNLALWRLAYILSLRPINPQKQVPFGEQWVLNLLYILWYHRELQCDSANRPIMFPSVDDCEWGTLTCGEPDELGQLHVETVMRDPLSCAGFDEFTMQRYGVGSIPSEIALLSRLKSLDLEFMGLTGQIPHELGTLTDLTYLGVSTNFLDGTLPKEIASLTKLETLDLSHNGLVGKFDNDFYRLQTLKKLHMLNNRFYEYISTRTVIDLPVLEELSMGGVIGEDQQLGGYIPMSFWNLSNLKHLHLQLISGSFHPNVAQMTSLEYMKVDLGFWDGTLPSEIGVLSKLTELDLIMNDITGIIPNEIADCVALQKLILWGNNMTGPLPTELTQSTSLEVLDLLDNRLTGTVPSTIWQMTQLSVLYLLDNRFDEYISATTVVTAPSLEELNLGHEVSDSGRDLGTLPPTFWTLTNLVSLTIKSIRGQFPTADLGDFQRLSDLEVRSPSFLGPLPSELGLLSTTMTYLYVDDNQLRHPIPTELATLTNLERLALRRSDMIGTIPQELFLQCTLLKEVLLDNNIFTGPIPATLGNLKSLMMLDLSVNRLNGTIPSTLAMVGTNADLILGENELSGSVPPNLCNVLSEANTGPKLLEVSNCFNRLVDFECQCCSTPPLKFCV